MIRDFHFREILGAVPEKLADRQAGLSLSLLLVLSLSISRTLPL